MPGVVTYEEVRSGEIKHAIRFTVPQSRRAYVWPARHYASSLTGTQYPRMGERFRLKATFDISGYPADVQVILRAMKKYGIILADNGSAWYISGKPDDRWNNTNLHTLGNLLGSNFEAVDASSLMIDPNSGAAVQNGVTVGVSPASATVRAVVTQRFTATVTGASGGVMWSVNGIAGGDAGVGQIDATREYFAPLTPTAPPTGNLTPTSTASPGSSGNAAVTVIPLPGITTVSPSSFPAGSFTLTITGAGFVTGCTVRFAGAATPSTVVSSTSMNATGNAPAPKSSVPVIVSCPDGTTSNTVFVTVTAATPVSVSMTPTSASVRVKQTRQFTATVLNTTNKTVTWKVNGIAGGNGTVGTIGTSGLYKAPNSVPNPATVTVTATSAADTSKMASAVVTITRH